MLNVLFNHSARMQRNAGLLREDGLTHTLEQRHVGYGCIALTGLGNKLHPHNEALKAWLQTQQGALQDIYAAAGITLYDPGTAPYSPDAGLDAKPNEVFAYDTLKVATARWVTFFDAVPTTGSGIELEKARHFGKFMMIFHHPDIRTSRMQPDGALHLTCRDINGSKDDILGIVQFLDEFDPCIGLDNGVKAMIGEHRETGAHVNLEKAVAERWPHMVYTYDGTKQILPLLLAETKQFAASAAELAA